MVQDMKAHSCLMGLEIEKILYAKPRVSVDSSLCHKHAVTLLIQPLKEWLKS